MQSTELTFVSGLLSEQRIWDSKCYIQLYLKVGSSKPLHSFWYFLLSTLSVPWLCFYYACSPGIHKQVFIEVTQCHTKEEKARQSYDLLWCLTVMTTALTEALKVLGWTWNTRYQRCWYKFKACLSYWENSRPAWAACGSSISKWKCRKRAGDIAQW